MFKSLTGSDTINAERKFESSFEFRPYARLVFSANSAPRSDDATHGFFRRWLVIPFNRTFDEKDAVPRAVLDARLSSPGELSGLLNKALDALPAIRAGRFTESESTSQGALEGEFRRTHGPVWAFGWIPIPRRGRKSRLCQRIVCVSAYGQARCQEAGRPGASGTCSLRRRSKGYGRGCKQHSDGWTGRNTRVFVGLAFVIRDTEPGSGLYLNQGVALGA